MVTLPCSFAYHYFKYFLSCICHTWRLLTLLSIFMTDLVRNLDFKIVLLFCILEAGDIEKNPGPNATEH